MDWLTDFKFFSILSVFRISSCFTCWLGCVTNILKKYLVLSPIPTSRFLPEIRIGFGNFFIFSALTFSAGNFTCVLNFEDCGGVGEQACCKEAFFLGLFHNLTIIPQKSLLKQSHFCLQRNGTKNHNLSAYSSHLSLLPHCHLLYALFPSNT